MKGGSFKEELENKKIRNSPVVQWLELRAFTAKGPGSIPDQETKTPQAAWHGQEEIEGK